MTANIKIIFDKMLFYKVNLFNFVK